MTVPASLSKCAHPRRSNTPRSSSSGPPGPCITPSTETCVVVVSFMVAVPFSLSLSSFDSTQAEGGNRDGQALNRLQGQHDTLPTRLDCKYVAVFKIQAAQAWQGMIGKLGHRDAFF